MITLSPPNSYLNCRQTSLLVSLSSLLHAYYIIYRTQLLIVTKEETIVRLNSRSELRGERAV